ncbi:MAG: flavodoxin domain-containing protein [Candidatus Thorarchaeota archaeon]
MKSVLIVYASRFGSTDEIAHEIAEELEKHKILTKVLDLRNGMNIPPVEEFDGIIVGSSIKMGRWTNESYRFLKKNQITLNNKILGLFVSSGEAADPKNHPEVRKKYLEKVMDRVGVKADMIEAFGGVFDFSTSSSYSFLEKKIIRRLAKSIEGGIIIEDDKMNDFRDWEKIRQWALDFSHLVRGN